MPWRQCAASAGCPASRGLRRPVDGDDDRASAPRLRLATALRLAPPESEADNRCDTPMTSKIQ
jgi:hypothetical protein